MKKIKEVTILKSRQMKLIALLLIILVAFTACQSEIKEEPTVKEPVVTNGETPVTPGERDFPERYHGDLVISTSAVATTIDAHQTNGLMANFQWAQNVYETAVVTSASGETYPLTCDFEYSDDGLTLKLIMLPDRYFSDGTPVTIEDVVASIERAGKFHTAFKNDFIDLIEDIIIDGDSVVYTFSKYNSNAMTLLGSVRGPVYIMKKDIITSLGEDGEITDISQVIGSGCYTLTKFVPDTEIVLTRNDYYIPVESDGTGPAAPRYAYCDTITFSVNVDATSRTAGLIAGDYHLGSIVREMQEEAERMGLKKIYLANGWTPSIFFNLDESKAGSPVFDKNFRKAVRAALDMEAIMLAIMENDEKSIVLTPSPVFRNSVYYNDILARTEWNIADKDLARKYLEESSYNGETIEWLCSQSASFYPAALVGTQMLNDIGIKAEIVLVDSGSHSTMRGDPTTGHDIGAWETQKSIIPTDQTSFVTGTAGGWWENEERTRLLDIMYSEKVGSEESIRAYEEFCKLAAEEVPWIDFGEKMTISYCVPELEHNYEGHIAYYWNSYFNK